MQFFPKAFNNINNRITKYMCDMFKSEWDFNYNESLKFCKQLRMYADRGDIKMYEIYLKYTRDICNKLHINLEKKLLLIKINKLNKKEVKAISNILNIFGEENYKNVELKTPLLFNNIRMFIENESVNKTFLLRCSNNNRKYILLSHNLKYNRELNSIIKQIEAMNLKQQLCNYDSKFNDYKLKDVFYHKKGGTFMNVSIDLLKQINFTDKKIHFNSLNDFMKLIANKYLNYEMSLYFKIFIEHKEKQIIIKPFIHKLDIFYCRNEHIVDEESILLNTYCLESYVASAKKYAELGDRNTMNKYIKDALYLLNNEEKMIIQKYINKNIFIVPEKEKEFWNNQLIYHLRIAKQRAKKGNSTMMNRYIEDALKYSKQLDKNIEKEIDIIRNYLI